MSEVPNTVAARARLRVFQVSIVNGRSLLTALRYGYGMGVATFAEAEAQFAADLDAVLKEIPE